MQDPLYFQCSFNRPNLRYTVIEKKGRSDFEGVANIVKRDYSGYTGIVYVLSRDNADELSSYLKNEGIISEPYHAGMKASLKSASLQGWLKGTIKVIVATIAFGMGIDKSNVRFVIHHNLAKSVEGYY